MASNIIACRKLGCRKSFKSYQQRIRHESKCEKSEVMPVLKFSQLDDGRFHRQKCEMVISQRNNLKRHVSRCGNGLNPANICVICRKDFKFKSKLERHMNQVTYIKIVMIMLLKIPVMKLISCIHMNMQMKLTKWTIMKEAMMMKLSLLILLI